MMHKSFRTALRMSALGMMIPLSLYITSWFVEQYFLPARNNGATISRTPTKEVAAPQESNRSGFLKVAPDKHPDLKPQDRIVPAGAVTPSGLHHFESTRVVGDVSESTKI